MGLALQGDYSVVGREVLLDEDFLRMNTMNDAYLMSQVLELFLRQVDRLLEALQEESDFEAIVDASHALKGCASSVGAFLLADAAARIEQLARSRTETWSDWLQELRERAANTRLVVQPLLEVR